MEFFKAALQINKDVEEINPESSLVVLRVNLSDLVQRYTKKGYTIWECPNCGLNFKKEFHY